MHGNKTSCPEIQANTAIGFSVTFRMLLFRLFGLLSVLTSSMHCSIHRNRHMKLFLDIKDRYILRKKLFHRKEIAEVVTENNTFNTCAALPSIVEVIINQFTTGWFLLLKPTTSWAH